MKISISYLCKLEFSSLQQMQTKKKLLCIEKESTVCLLTAPKNIKLMFLLDDNP